MKQIGVLIVDDNAITRAGLRSLLEGESDIVIVGEAASGSEAIEIMKQAPADVVLMNISMQGIDGIEVIERIMQISPDARVLVITLLSSPRTLARAILAGATGCLTYGDFGPEDIAREIRRLASAETVRIPPSVASVILGLDGHGQRARQPMQTPTSDSLTPRERQVLGMIGDGRSNDEIAHLLGIREKTVKNYLNSLYAKLSLGNSRLTFGQRRDLRSLPRQDSP